MGRRFAAQMGAPLTAQSIEIATLEIRHHRQNGATLTPYEGTVFHGYYQPEGEAKREAVNAWIRKGDFDAVIDGDRQREAVACVSLPRTIRADNQTAPREARGGRR